jgi:hypothetical protein
MNTGPMVILSDQVVVCDRHCEHKKHVEHLDHVLRIQRAVRLVVQLTAKPPTAVTPLIYSCSDLEVLWTTEGGAKDEAFTAAEIAEAESGGNPNALSPTDDRGLWQINASHGSLSTFNPQANAKAAILISDDGTDWEPWTTYVEGSYIDKC